MVSKEDILLSSFVSVESAHAFSAFLPSVFTIQKLAIPQNAINELRKGYIPAITFALALSTIVSVITKSQLPLIFGTITIAFMILTYEYAIKDGLKNASQ